MELASSCLRFLGGDVLVVVEVAFRFVGWLVIGLVPCVPDLVVTIGGNWRWR